MISLTGLLRTWRLKPTLVLGTRKQWWDWTSRGLVLKPILVLGTRKQWWDWLDSWGGGGEGASQLDKDKPAAGSNLWRTPVSFHAEYFYFAKSSRFDIQHKRENFGWPLFVYQLLNIVSVIKLTPTKGLFNFRHWVGTGARNTDISGETTFCDSNVLKVKCNFSCNPKISKTMLAQTMTIGINHMFYGHYAQKFTPFFRSWETQPEPEVAASFWPFRAGAAWKNSQEPEPLKNYPAPQPFLFWL